ncbi:MAG: hypothetical protein IKN43_11145 [Selenomonadaceae bacterium]|nr:hypothetical protein [Selenomonadaceae bacterium]
MRGGARPGAGRPLTAGVVRKQRQTRATDDEWQLINAFAKLVKHGDRKACEAFLAKHEQTKYRLKAFAKYASAFSFACFYGESANVRVKQNLQYGLP